MAIVDFNRASLSLIFEWAGKGALLYVDDGAAEAIATGAGVELLLGEWLPWAWLTALRA